MELDWTFQMKNGLPKVSRQALIPGGSVEISHENLLGDSQSLSVSLSSSDWRNPAQDLGFQMSYTEPFYAPNTTRNVQVCLSSQLLCMEQRACTKWGGWDVCCTFERDAPFRCSTPSPCTRSTAPATFRCAHGCSR